MNAFRTAISTDLDNLPASSRTTVPNMDHSVVDLQIPGMLFTAAELPFESAKSAEMTQKTRDITMGTQNRLTSLSVMGSLSKIRAFCSISAEYGFCP